MTRTADVVILGAGFAGAATAWHLVQRGVRNILLLEAEDRPGVHASGRNASLVCHLLRDAKQAEMATDGARFYSDPPEGFASRPLFRRSGSFWVASEDGRVDLEEKAREGVQRGLQVRHVDSDELATRIPLLRSAPIASAIEVPEDGIVDIAALLNAYLDGAIAGGATVLYGKRATSIQTSGVGIAAVVAGSEKIETPCLVNAAGGWAGEVGRLAGVGDRTIHTLLRHVYQSAPDTTIDAEWPFVWHDDVQVYFRPEAGGLLLSPCDERLVPPGDARPDSEGERQLREKLARVFPALLDFPISVSRACMRTYTADRRLLIGRDPELDGLVWVAGLGGHGMSMSWSVGAAGAAAVLGEPSPHLGSFPI